MVTLGWSQLDGHTWMVTVAFEERHLASFAFPVSAPSSLSLLFKGTISITFCVFPVLVHRSPLQVLSRVKKPSFGFLFFVAPFVRFSNPCWENCAELVVVSAIQAELITYRKSK
jgi:hypothetical protein